MIIKQKYAAPQLGVIKLNLPHSFMLMAPSGDTDSGVHFSSGDDDEEGLEGNAKRYHFSVWDDETAHSNVWDKWV